MMDKGRAMAKPVRSPLTGYNHNVQYFGRVFHIQTEDSGPINPHIFTHLFYGGTILVSRKHRYDATTSDETVRKLMQAQHKSMLRELVQHQHDERIRGFFAAKGEVLQEDAPGAQPAVPMGGSDSLGAGPESPGAIPVVSYPLSASSGMAQGVNVAAERVNAHRVGEPGTPGPTGRTPEPRAARASETPGPTPPPTSSVVIVTPPPVTTGPAPSQRLPQAAKPTRSPFVRSGQNVVTTSSADGVVVQRSVVSGGGRTRSGGAGGKEGRAPRLTEAFRTPTPAETSTPPSTVIVTPPPQTKSSNTPAPTVSHASVATPTPTPAWGAAVTPPPAVVRPIGPLVDDKSLDEVILEYLADDGVDEGLG
jgi:hypothetical protein